MSRSRATLPDVTPTDTAPLLTLLTQPADSAQPHLAAGF